MPPTAGEARPLGQPDQLRRRRSQLRDQDEPGQRRQRPQRGGHGGLRGTTSSQHVGDADLLRPDHDDYSAVGVLAARRPPPQPPVAAACRAPATRVATTTGTPTEQTNTQPHDRVARPDQTGSNPSGSDTTNPSNRPTNPSEYRPTGARRRTPPPGPGGNQGGNQNQPCPVSCRPAASGRPAAAATPAAAGWAPAAGTAGAAVASAPAAAVPAARWRGWLRGRFRPRRARSRGRQPGGAAAAAEGAPGRGGLGGGRGWAWVAWAAWVVAAAGARRRGRHRARAAVVPGRARPARDVRHRRGHRTAGDRRVGKPVLEKPLTLHVEALGPPGADGEPRRPARHAETAGRVAAQVRPEPIEIEARKEFMRLGLLDNRGRVDVEVAASLAVLCRAGAEFYGWINEGDKTKGVLAGAIGREAMLAVRDGDMVTVTQIRPETLPMALVSQTPDVAPSRGEAVNVLRSDMLASAGGRQRTAAGVGMRPAPPEVRIVQQIMAQPTTGGGELYVAVRDRVGRRKSVPDPLRYADTADRPLAEPHDPHQRRRATGPRRPGHPRRPGGPPTGDAPKPVALRRGGGRLVHRRRLRLAVQARCVVNQLRRGRRPPVLACRVRLSGPVPMPGSSGQWVGEVPGTVRSSPSVRPRPAPPRRRGRSGGPPRR